MSPVLSVKIAEYLSCDHKVSPAAEIGVDTTPVAVYYWQFNHIFEDASHEGRS